MKLGNVPKFPKPPIWLFLTIIFLLLIKLYFWHYRYCWCLFMFAELGIYKILNSSFMMASLRGYPTFWKAVRCFRAVKVAKRVGGWVKTKLKLNSSQQRWSWGWAWQQMLSKLSLMIIARKIKSKTQSNDQMHFCCGMLYISEFPFWILKQLMNKLF